MCLKARWPYCFASQSLGPGTLTNDSLADQRKQDGVYGRMSVDLESVAGFHDQPVENATLHK